MRNVSVKQAAFVLEKPQQFVRIGLQRKLLPIGTAINMSGRRWSYQIPLGALAAYMNMDSSEVVELINSL